MNTSLDRRSARALGAQLLDNRSALTLPALDPSVGPQVKGRDRPIYWLRRLPLDLLKLIVWAHAVWIVFIAWMCLAYTIANPSVTGFMLYRWVHSDWGIEAPVYVRLDDVADSAKAMLMRAEDFHFTEHHGIDFGAVKEAAQRNKTLGREAFGGSTLTMQLARTLFLTPDRNYLRKYLEAIAAVEIDFILGKKRVMELYFNTAEWGKGVFGIGAAAAIQYHTTTKELSWEKLRRLVTILASPIKYNVGNFWNSRALVYRYYSIDGGVSAKALAPFRSKRR
jgi:monofunctional glycosyltransferase